MIIFFIVLCFLCFLPAVFSLCSKSKTIKDFCDRMIYIYGWIFIPFYPFLFVLSLFSRIEKSHLIKDKSLLMGKTWEEIRRRNFYLGTDIFVFFVYCACIFSLARYGYERKFFTDDHEIRAMFFCISNVFLVWIPPMILHNIFERYEQSLQDKSN